MAASESNSPHAKATRDGLAYFKKLSASLEDWEFQSESEGVSLYTRDIPDSPLPIVRGDAVLRCKPEEFSPMQVATATVLPGCRKIWDEKIERTEIKQVYSRFESLFLVKMIAPWPVYPRDFSATSFREISDDVCYVSMVSVEDELNPLDPECVRGNLVISGWKIQRVSEGIAITYITQVDLAGYIPYRLLKTIQVSVPMCAGKVVEYLNDFGFPPTFSSYTPSVKFIGESFDHDSRSYDLTVEAEGEEGEIYCQTSKRMYPNGAKTRLEGTGTVESTADGVSVKGIKGKVTLHLFRS